MRSFKKPKPKTPTILQQQSSKLKEKLQLLRQQVTLKKQQKQMSKTATSMQSNKMFSKTPSQNNILSATTQGNMHVPDGGKRLHDVLVEMKLESLQEKLKEKGVKSYERLMQLGEEEIDQWKDVAVGWRIKLKKNVRGLRERREDNKMQSVSSSMLKKNTSPNSTITQPLQQTPSPQQTQPPQQKHIQQIIRQRKQQKIFFPITRQIQQLNQEDYSQYQQSSMPDQDQDVIIQSFMKVFQPRKGILYKESRLEDGGNKKGQLKRGQEDLRQEIRDNDVKKDGLENSKSNVNWSQSVQEMERQSMRKNHKIYPKETILKQALIHMHQEQSFSKNNTSQSKQQTNLRYCWKCFTKIDLKLNQKYQTCLDTSTTSQKYFCSQNCQLFYSQEVDCFQSNLQQEEEKYDRQLTMQRSSLQQDSQREQEDDLEIIDLSIL